jgi:hypothetical protein
MIRDILNNSFQPRHFRKIQLQIDRSKNCKEPPLQELLPKGGQLDAFGDISPGPPQRPRHHRGESLIAARGISRHSGAQLSRSLPVGFRDRLHHDLLFLEKAPGWRRRAAAA